MNEDELAKRLREMRDDMYRAANRYSLAAIEKERAEVFHRRASSELAEAVTAYEEFIKQVTMGTLKEDGPDEEDEDDES